MPYAGHEKKNSDIEQLNRGFNYSNEEKETMILFPIFKNTAEKLSLPITTTIAATTQKKKEELEHTSNNQNFHRITLREPRCYISHSSINDPKKKIAFCDLRRARHYWWQKRLYGAQNTMESVQIGTKNFLNMAAHWVSDEFQDSEPWLPKQPSQNQR